MTRMAGAVHLSLPSLAPHAGETLPGAPEQRFSRTTRSYVHPSSQVAHKLYNAKKSTQAAAVCVSENTEAMRIAHECRRGLPTKGRAAH